MSYSFTITAASKLEAMKAVEAELDKVVASQPVHAVDRRAALATAATFIDMLPEAPDMDVRVSMHGSVCSADQGLYSVGVGVTAFLVQRL